MNRPLPTLATAAVLSATVWALSPWLAGHPEPWDADGFYYLGALAMPGFIGGAISPRPLWAHYLGSVVGQACYQLLVVETGPLFLVGIGFLLAYGWLFVAGAVIGGRVGVLIRNP